MKDGAEHTGSPIDTQFISRRRDGGAFAATQAVKLAKAVTLLVFVALGLLCLADRGLGQSDRDRKEKVTGFDAQISSNAQQMLEEGRRIFRFDTFGDEVFWGDKLKLHQAIQGSKFGGVGAGVSPKAALAVGLSTVDDAFMPGVGRRLDGWPNRDLNVGAIISMAPDLSAFTNHLRVDEATVKKVLASWGPGKFDAELNLDGKA